MKSLVPAKGWYLIDTVAHDPLPVAAFALIDEGGNDIIVPLVAQDDRLVQANAVTDAVRSQLVYRPRQKRKKREKAA